MKNYHSVLKHLSGFAKLSPRMSNPFSSPAVPVVISTRIQKICPPVQIPETHTCDNDQIEEKSGDHDAYERTARQQLGGLGTAAHVHSVRMHMHSSSLLPDRHVKTLDQ